MEDNFYSGDIYAFSYFYDIYAEPFHRVEMGFTVGDIEEAYMKTCASVQEESCMNLGFIYHLLKDGYHLPKSRDLKTAKKIRGIETGWCLGAALSILAL